MKITFTKCIYEDYEVDVPLEVYENTFHDCREAAVLEYMHDARKVGEEVEVDNIELGPLDHEDREYQEQQFKEWEREAILEENEYLEDLI